VAFKLRILRAADACTERGQLGALLRREGLYSSHLITWRRQREQGVLDALEPRKRGRKARPVDPQARKVAELERDNRRLQKRLERAEMIIDFQKRQRSGDPPEPPRRRERVMSALEPSFSAWRQRGAGIAALV
jgi:hypothetical protein